ncbi:MAG: ABC transporter permease [Chloroflexota bacterium]
MGRGDDPVALTAEAKVQPPMPSRLRVASRSRRPPLVPTGILALFVLVAIFGPSLAPHSATDVALQNSFRPPVWQVGGSAEFLLGTDKLGRDILSRIMSGARISLLVIIASIPIAGTIGVGLGMVAAYRGKWFEATVMRLVDVKLSLPTTLLALLFAVVWGPSFTNLLILVVLTLWAVYARMAHAEALSLKQRDYILAARVIGASGTRIVLLHILPGLISTIAILATLQIAQVVLIEAALSYLGVGIPPPTPAWGLMIADGRSDITRAWWVSTMPGIALSLVILSGNLVGDWLRDYLDPTLRNLKQ